MELHIAKDGKIYRATYEGYSVPRVVLGFEVGRISERTDKHYEALFGKVAMDLDVHPPLDTVKVKLFHNLSSREQWWLERVFRATVPKGQLEEIVRYSSGVASVRWI
jgi:hypothetical protein